MITGHMKDEHSNPNNSWNNDYGYDILMKNIFFYEIFLTQQKWAIFLDSR